ncbi:MAG: Uma2 family endonuclease [Planctomycetaceae bacterium]|nr:Uma2 family endonuclease [Planctomycetaceae bacterium]
MSEPTWEVARLFPRQGHWTIEEYLSLEATGGCLVEFVDGVLEFPKMPKRMHQRIVRYLMRVIEKVIGAGVGGEVLDAPFPVYVEPSRYREPDIVYQRPGRPDADADYADGADLVIEVVSDDVGDRKRDLVTKRAEYAQAGIPEYWIVDPETRTIHVLTLDGVEPGGAYRVHGDFKAGETASSVLLDGFAVSVDEVFKAGDGEANMTENAPSGRG